jgi:hypothetical protein
MKVVENSKPSRKRGGKEKRLMCECGRIATVVVSGYRICTFCKRAQDNYYASRKKEGWND